MRHRSITHWEYPRQGQVGREESPRLEASSRWTLSNETSIPDHASLALMRMPLGCSQPHPTGHGFSLGLTDNSSPRTMMLAPSGVRNAPSPKGVKPANEGWRFPPEQTAFNKKGNWEWSELKEQESPQRSPRLLQGLGGYPHGGRSRDPNGNSTIRRTPVRAQVLKQGLGGYYQGYQ